MSHSGDLFTLSDGVNTEANFEIVVRGYRIKEVDAYIAEMEAELANLEADRAQSVAQIQALAAQVD